MQPPTMSKVWESLGGIGDNVTTAAIVFIEADVVVRTNCL